MQAGTNDHVRVYTYEARDGQVRVQPKTAAPSLALKDPEHYQKTCTLSPDGRLLAVASTDGQVQLHRYPSLEPVFSPHTGVLSLGEEVYGTDFSHDSKLLAVTLASRIVLLSTTPRTVDGTTPVPPAHRANDRAAPNRIGPPRHVPRGALWPRPDLRGRSDACPVCPAPCAGDERQQGAP